jgi:hypothetical protein
VVKLRHLSQAALPYGLGTCTSSQLLPPPPNPLEALAFALAFNYLYLNFITGVCNLNSMIIDIFLYLNNFVEVLRNNCHKRWRVVKLRNLLLKFEVPFIFHVMFFCRILN